MRRFRSGSRSRTVSERRVTVGVATAVAALATLAMFTTTVADAYVPDDPDAPESAARTADATPVPGYDLLGDEVAAMLGRPFEKPVPTVLVDRDAAVEHALGRLAKAGGLERFEAFEHAWEMLGIVPADRSILDDFLSIVRDQAGGFYDPDREAYFVIEGLPPIMQEIVAFHELVHAHEDQRYDLDGLILADPHNDDRAFAVSALVEGSATLAMNAHLTRRMLGGGLDMGAMQRFLEEEQERMQLLRTLPSPLVRAFIGPYALGPAFLQEEGASPLVAEWPEARVAAAYASPPRSSEQILHPEKYWDPATRDDPVVLDDGPAPGRRWTLEARGVLGELTIASWLSARKASGPDTGRDWMLRPAAEWTNDGAEGWGGDVWELWRKGSRRALHWRAVWDTERDAEEFARALDPELARRLRRSGRRTALWLGDVPAKARERWAAWLDAAAASR